MGGTEIYVESLVHHLQRQNVEGIVAVPDVKQTISYRHNGIEVRRFAVAPDELDIRDRYGAGDAYASAGFAKILDAEKPDLIHLHSITPATSLHLVAEAEQRNIPLVFTYHLPTASCQRGTLLRWGHELCDGKLDVRRCSACSLHSMGLPRIASMALAQLPVCTGDMLHTLGRSNGVWISLRMTELMHIRHRTFRSLMERMQAIVVLCEWTRELLLRNGVPAERMLLSRHGLPQTLPERPDPRQTDAKPLRIAFLGRMVPIKGPDVLIRALQGIPEAAIELHLYGTIQNANQDRYSRELRALADADRRIEFRQSVANDQVIDVLKNYDLLAVPSQWLETGPLVVLEAFAAGIPVIGSNLGGIAELVRHGEDGILVQYDMIEAWTVALARLAADPAELDRLRSAVRPPRSMAQVAGEMLSLYRCLLKPQGLFRLRQQGN